MPIVKKNDPINTMYADGLIHFGLRPYPKSHIRCLTPVNVWYQSAQTELANNKRTAKEVYKVSIIAKYSAPEERALNQIITSMRPITKPMPVIRCNIESTDVICGLYIIKCGDNGRFTLAEPVIIKSFKNVTMLIEF